MQYTVYKKKLKKINRQKSCLKNVVENCVQELVGEIQGGKSGWQD